MSKLVFILVAVLVVAVNAQSKFTAAQKDQLLFGHNKARIEKGVAPLVWDDTVAAYAQAYSDSCPPGPAHHAGSPYGENIAWGGGLGMVTSNKMWIDDEYPTKWQCPDAISGSNYNHYTQVMWANTKKVGCGITAGCSYGTFIVCNFDPPGNYMGQKPYPGACNTIKPCTPSRTCTEAGGTFTDTRCGLVTCCGANICAPGGSTSAPSTPAPTASPTVAPTRAPTQAPTSAPSTGASTAAPTSAPNTAGPTPAPTRPPTVRPTTAPTNSPTGTYYIYTSSVQNGWSAVTNGVTVSHGFAYSGQAGLSVPLSGSGGTNFIMFQHAAVSNIWSTLRFWVAASGNANVLVYWNGGYYQSKPVNANWQQISIPMASLGNPNDSGKPFTSIGGAVPLVFQNGGTTPFTLYLSQIACV